jgi:hypothetical protein
MIPFSGFSFGFCTPLKRIADEMTKLLGGGDTDVGKMF